MFVANTEFCTQESEAAIYCIIHKYMDTAVFQTNIIYKDRQPDIWPEHHMSASP